MGICNGFQILCEAGLLPGALIRNRSLQFRSEFVHLRVIHDQSPFTQCTPDGTLLRIPIAHGEGCYYADEKTLAEMEDNRQILWKYANSSGDLKEHANPNGSVQHIAGVCSREGNVAGLMPHPERACQKIIGNDDGQHVFRSIIQHLTQTH